MSLLTNPQRALVLAAGLASAANDRTLDILKIVSKLLELNDFTQLLLDGS